MDKKRFINIPIDIFDRQKYLLQAIAIFRI